MTRTQRIVLGVILAVGFLGRAGYAWRYPQWGPNHTIPSPDEYARLAQTLLDHGSLLTEEGNFSAHREPAYPAFLALIFLVGRSYRWAQWVQCVLGTVSVGLLFLLGKQVWDARTGLVAAAIGSLYPQWVYYAGLLYRETWMIFIVLIGLLFLLWSYRHPCTRHYAWSGVVQALGPLTNSAFLPFGLLMVPGMIAWLHRNSPRRWVWVGVYLLGFVPLYGVWVARNFYHFHAWVVGVVGGGANLYVYQVVPPNLAGTEAQKVISQNDPIIQGSTHLGDMEKDKYFYRQGIRLALRHPLHFLGLCVQRILKLWRLYPYPRDYAHHYRLLKIVSLASDGWIIPLGLVGMLLLGFKKPETLYWYALLFSTSAVYALLWAMIRYRLPMMVPMILFCAYTLSWLFEKFQEKLCPKSIP
ncbi:MAG: glycosyltransferase family 39 protein [Elusimicrobia bacterium]|nr:glycosyltransferase family 39 protein [Elusimicrobiota bacterium]